MVYFRHVAAGITPVGTKWSTTLHSASASDLGTVQTAWNQFCTTFVGGTLAAMWNTHTSLQSTSTYQLDPTTGKAAAVATTANVIPGTGTGGSVSSRSAAVFTTRSTVPGRKGHGRMYWPSPDDSHYQTTGQLVNADATSLETGFRTAYGTFKVTSVGIIWHKTLLIGDNIVEVELNINLGSQRRRTSKAARVAFGGPV